jgi:hypothetical protein
VFIDQVIEKPIKITRIKEILVPVDKFVEVTVEKIVYGADKIIEKIVEVTKIKEIIKRVEVPFETI